MDSSGGREYIESYAENLVKDLKSIPEELIIDNIFYPGENSLLRRKNNLKNGVPVDSEIWHKVNDL